MVLEYVDGLPLHKLRAMLSIGGEKVEDSAALFIASRVFEALAAAHAARDPESGELAPVIHRDINPSNVLVPWDANVKVSDFGIAKAGGTRADTKMGFVKGTYGYLAPEQVKGEDVTVRADIYAASLLLWELLARRKEIQRGAMSEVGVLQAMAQPEFPPLDVIRPDVDPLVRDAVRRGLAVNPDERSITAEEMVGVLAGAMKEDEGRATLARAIARVRPAPGETTGEILALKAAEASVDRSAPLSLPPATAPLPPATAQAEPSRAASDDESAKPAPLLVEPPPLPEADPSPEPVPPPMPVAPAQPSVSSVGVTPAVAVSAIPPVRAAPSRAPRRDLALVVVLLAALIGVAIVAFYLWSQEGSRSAFVSASVPAPAPSTFPAPVASAPDPVHTSVAAVAAPESPSAGGPAASASSAIPSSEASSPVSASARVARPAGSDLEAAAAGLGDIFTAASAGGHRVFLDGRVVGESPASIRVRCGKHEVRVGGNGISQPVDIPCGGSVLVNPKWPAPSDDHPAP
jgi:serine/threonine-protein kinase